MDLKPSLLLTVGAYCEATGLSKARVATIVANDGKFFARLEAGGGCTVRTYERAMHWFSASWPAEAAWPAGVSRPQPIAEVAL